MPDTIYQNGFQRNGHAGVLDHNGDPWRSSAEGGPDSAFALPQVSQFAAMLGNAWKTWYTERYDEALRNSRDDALHMRNDAFLMSLMNERKLGTASLKWHLEVDNDRDPWERAVRDGVTGILKATPRWQSFIWELLEAIWYGRYGSQLVWEWKDMRLPSMPQKGAAGLGQAQQKPGPFDKETRRVLAIKAHLPVNGDLITHDYDGVPLVRVYPNSLPPGADRCMTNLGWAVRLKGTWRRRFVIHHHERHAADFFEAERGEAIHGVGIRSTLYWMNWLRLEWLSNIADWCTRTGLGVRLWYFQGGNKASKDAVAKAAREQTDKVNILVPRFGDRAVEGVEYVDTAGTGTDLLLKLHQHAMEIIERYVIGQTLSSGTEGSGLGGTGVASMHAATKAKIIAFDANNLADTLTEDVIKQILFWSYREFRDMPLRFVFDVDKPEPEKLAQAAKTFIDMGGTVREDDIRSALGFGEAVAGDKVLGGRQAGMPGEPVAPGGPGQPPAGPDGGTPPGGPSGQGGPAPGTAPDGGPPAPEGRLPFGRSAPPDRYAIEDDEGHLHGEKDGRFVGKGGGDSAKKAEKTKEKRAAPGSQMPEAQKVKLREHGMTGTFPPADVPMTDMKIADLSRDSESLKFEPLMSWNQTTKSGRVSRQYRYTQEFHDRNAAQKFERVAAIEPHIGEISKRLTAQMTDKNLPAKQREAAAIASVIRETGLRPTDGDESIKHGHFGISSLQVRHAKPVGDEIHLDFIGKEGVRNQTVIRDPANVDFVKAAMENKGDKAFIFGAATSDNAGDALNEASKAVGGPEDIKIKDLRTLKATQAARRVVDSFAGPPPPLTGVKAKDVKAICAAILKMSGEVAKVLNNTPTQARDNYIHPEIFKQWQEKLSVAS